MALRSISEEMWMKLFSERLSRLISESGMTQDEFAKAAHITKGAVSRYVNGKSIPSARAIINMARVLRVSIERLINFGCEIV